MTVGRVQRNCDKFFDVCVQAEREVQYRDTVIQIPPIPFKLPESKIDISLSLKIVGGRANLPKQVKTMGLITTQVEILNDKMHVRSWLNDSTILVKPDPVYIGGATKIITETRKVPVKYIPRIYAYALWIVIIQITLIVVYLILKLKLKLIDVAPGAILTKILFCRK